MILGTRNQEIHFGCLIVWVFIFYSLNSTVQDLQWTNVLQGEVCLERGGV